MPFCEIFHGHGAEEADSLHPGSPVLHHAPGQGSAVGLPRHGEGGVDELQNRIQHAVAGGGGGPRPRSPHARQVEIDAPPSGAFFKHRLKGPLHQAPVGLEAVQQQHGAPFSPLFVGEVDAPHPDPGLHG